MDPRLAECLGQVDVIVVVKVLVSNAHDFVREQRTAKRIPAYEHPVDAGGDRTAHVVFPRSTASSTACSTTVRPNRSMAAASDASVLTGPARPRRTQSRDRPIPGDSSQPGDHRPVHTSLSSRLGLGDLDLLYGPRTAKRKNSEPVARSQMHNTVVALVSSCLRSISSNSAPSAAVSGSIRMAVALLVLAYQLSARRYTQAETTP